MVSEPTGVGRGGKRKGAGRHPKKARPFRKSEKRIAADFIASIIDTAVAGPPDLEKLREKALRTLEAIVDSTFTEDAPRVSAAKALLAVTGGKKGAGDKADKPSRFAPRAPPRLAVDNTKA